ncbi:MAG: precorrin-8X methylmutase [Veillonellales bacterium]
MNYITDPGMIETKSMKIISTYLEGLSLPPDKTKVFSRIIHAAGDPDYANHIRIHPDAIQDGCAALAGGSDIYCDVEMVRTGINKRELGRYGGNIHCLIADDAIARIAKDAGITRSMAAMRQFGDHMDGAVVAIGNAPTALFELLKIMAETSIRPALIVGIPVGFVGAAESKSLLETTSKVPYITVQGSKGGSPIAAAVINALLYMMR